MTAPVRQVGGSGILGQLSGFFTFLRDRGIQAGVGTGLDLARAVGVLGFTDRSVFRDACRVTIAKSPEELAILDEAFDAYWSGSRGMDSPPTTVQAAIPVSPPPDGMTDRRPAPGPAAVPLDRIRTMTVGLYSPDAPSAGHPMYKLDPRRVAALRTGARRFRREAATLPGRRLVTSHRGRIDLRATTKRSIRSGGEWLELRRRERKPLRAELIILWDVSGSMREHDSVLFALVYTLHRVSRRTRVFAFSTELEEITDRLEGVPYSRAARALSATLEHKGGGTRIGRSLHEFRRRHATQIHPWTTLLIISDGWDLGDVDLLSAELGRLRRKASHLVWVNPYARRPDFEPATLALQAALPHVEVMVAPEDFEARRPFHLAWTRWSGDRGAGLPGKDF